jgi:hypothetical protein
MSYHWERLHRIHRSLSLEDTDVQDCQDVRKEEDIHYCEDAEDIHDCEALQVCLDPNDNLGHKEPMLRLLSCVNMR